MSTDQNQSSETKTKSKNTSANTTSAAAIAINKLSADELALLAGTSVSIKQDLAKYYEALHGKIIEALGANKLLRDSDLSMSTFLEDGLMVIINKASPITVGLSSDELMKVINGSNDATAIMSLVKQAVSLVDEYAAVLCKFISDRNFSLSTDDARLLLISLTVMGSKQFELIIHSIIKINTLKKEVVVSLAQLKSSIPWLNFIA